MTKSNISITLSLLVLTFLVSCGESQSVAPTTSPEPPALTATPVPQEELEIDPIQVQLDAMTTEEKVGQLLTVGFTGISPDPKVSTYLKDCHVGGFILFARNVQSAQQVAQLTNDLKSMNPSAIPLFLGVDQEGGLVDRMPPEMDRTPSAFSIGQQNDSDLVYQYGQVLGTTCAALGFNMDFAPSVDVWSNPNNKVIGQRALGKSFESVTQLAPYAVQGLGDAGVLPVIKHFPGHGDTDTDSHTALPIIYKSQETLWTAELAPFRAVLDAQIPTGVMVSHLLLPELDDKYPASLSHTIVTDLLRGEMGFDGLVVTDDMTMGAITGSYDLPDACLMAVQAGCDLLLVCHGEDTVEAAYQTLLTATQTGDLPLERLDQSVYRILTAKAALTDDPIDPPDVPALNQAIRGLK